MIAIKHFCKRNIKLLAVLLLFVLAVVFYLQHETQGQRELRLVNAMFGWVHSFDAVDMIVLHYGDNYQHTFSRAENYREFDRIKGLLNPFARLQFNETVGYHGAFAGNSQFDVTKLEKTARITYFKMDSELFYVNIYLAPEDINLFGAEYRALHFNGDRALVVLDESGWFGAFGSYHVYLSDLVNP